MDSAGDISATATASTLFAKYGTRIDNQSAREILAARVEEKVEEAVEEEPPAAEPKPKKPGKKAKESAGAMAGGADAIGKVLNSREGQKFQRNLIRNVLGMLTKKK